jgi:hypothetical protein
MFRFTIRDVLWLMVVVAVSLGWWANSRALTNVARDLKETNKGLWSTGVSLTVRNQDLESENRDLKDQLQKASADENQPALFNP